MLRLILKQQCSFCGVKKGPVNDRRNSPFYVEIYLKPGKYFGSRKVYAKLYNNRTPHVATSPSRILTSVEIWKSGCLDQGNKYSAQRRFLLAVYIILQRPRSKGNRRCDPRSPEYPVKNAGYTNKDFHQNREVGSGLRYGGGTSTPPEVALPDPKDGASEDWLIGVADGAS